MPDQDFRVGIYRLSLPDGSQRPMFPFSDSIKRAYNISLEDRLTNINGRDHRLEHFKSTDEYFLANFATLAYSGPGRTDQTTQVSPIELNPSESFAFETAMLYDETRNYAFIESSRNGVGAGAITLYFKAFALEATRHEFVAVLDEEASNRARSFKKISRLNMQVAIGPITAYDRAAGIGVLKGFGTDYGADVINVELAVSRPRQRSLVPGVVWRAIDAMSPRENEDISALDLSGRESDDGKTELIDLLHHRQKRECTLEIDEESRNVPHRVRWDALEVMWRDFIS